jgi:hypothetical protein
MLRELMAVFAWGLAARAGLCGLLHAVVRVEQHRDAGGAPPAAHLLFFFKKNNPIWGLRTRLKTS